MVFTNLFTKKKNKKLYNEWILGGSYTELVYAFLLQLDKCMFLNSENLIISLPSYVLHFNIITCSHRDYFKIISYHRIKFASKAMFQDSILRSCSSKIQLELT